MKGTYVEESYYDSATDTVKVREISEPFEKDLEEEKIHLIDTAITIAGVLEYEYEYQSTRVADFDNSESTNEASTAIRYIWYKTVCNSDDPPSCREEKFHKLRSNATGGVFEEMPVIVGAKLNGKPISVPGIPSSGASLAPNGETFITSDVQGKLREVMEYAQAQIGKPYVWGGTSPQEGFDCSGLYQWAFKQAGINIPRVTTDQVKSGMAVSVSDMQPGDLIFFNTQGTYSHVGMYWGNDTMLHAPSKGKTVTFVKLSTYYKKPSAVRRIIVQGNPSVSRSNSDIMMASYKQDLSINNVDKPILLSFNNTSLNNNIEYEKPVYVNKNQYYEVDNMLYTVPQQTSNNQQEMYKPQLLDYTNNPQPRTPPGDEDVNDEDETNINLVEGDESPQSKYIYDFFANYESDVPNDVLIDFTFKDRIDYSSGAFDTANIGDYDLEVGSGVNTPKFEKAKKWFPIAEKYGKMYGVDPFVILAMITQESSGDPNASSGAYKGLMQTNGGTVTAFNVLTNSNDTFTLSKSELFDPDKNVRFGTMKLAKHMADYNGDIIKGVSAHNQGPGTVNLAVKKCKEDGGSRAGGCDGAGWMYYIEDARDYYAKKDGYTNNKSASNNCAIFPSWGSKSGSTWGDTC
ncbi:MAG: transglycosylase SLT domain-containing protein, partial [Clostridiales bacterium]|nr:transglycosylase SLT domain-containing protein [Clostridiales bacterium]